jgi:hypothetical protein
MLTSRYTVKQCLLEHFFTPNRVATSSVHSGSSIGLLRCFRDGWRSARVKSLSKGTITNLINGAPRTAGVDRDPIDQTCAIGNLGRELNPR